jgi:dTDP-4-amino-4,6-dideoxygalactose transaminase
MITTNDEALVKDLRMMRNYGQQDRYHHPLKGFNSRLDEVQAAVLSAKLKHLDQWNERRRVIASSYQNRIRNDAVTILLERKYGKHVYHLYVVRVSRRSEFQSHLLAHGIETLIHYPIPIHKQESYQDLGYKLGDFPVTERLAEEIVSLPIYPELTDDEIDYICGIMNDFKSSS